MKQSSQGSGPGGDWAVRVAAAHRVRDDPPPPPGTPAYAPSQRISFLFYVADETEPAEEWSLSVHDGRGEGTGGDAGGQGDLEMGPAPRKLLAGGHTKLGAWSLHAVAGKQSTGATLNYLAGARGYGMPWSANLYVSACCPFALFQTPAEPIGVRLIMHRTPCSFLTL